jgi:hypothetical protein
MYMNYRRDVQKFPLLLQFKQMLPILMCLQIFISLNVCARACVFGHGALALAKLPRYKMYERVFMGTLAWTTQQKEICWECSQITLIEKSVDNIETDFKWTECEDANWLNWLSVNWSLLFLLTSFKILFNFICCVVSNGWLAVNDNLGCGYGLFNVLP